jgi:antibiotic biosynthesis monooxygenase (ABM) superfamily enzyme
MGAWAASQVLKLSGFVTLSYDIVDTSLQLLQRGDVQPVTVVVARRIKPERGHVYQDWVVGVAAASEAFAGNLGTSLILPGEGDNRWVLLYRYAIKALSAAVYKLAYDLPCSVLRYNSLANLEAWHSSDVRAAHLKQLEELEIVEAAAEYETQSGCVELRCMHVCIRY